MRKPSGSLLSCTSSRDPILEHCGVKTRRKERGDEKKHRSPRDPTPTTVTARRALNTWAYFKKHGGTGCLTC